MFSKGLPIRLLEIQVKKNKLGQRTTSVVER